MYPKWYDQINLGIHAFTPGLDQPYHMAQKVGVGWESI
jgi:hypothetical protein